MDFFIRFLTEKSVSYPLSRLIATISASFLIILICVITYFIVKYKILRFIKYLITKSKSKFDDLLLDSGTFRHIPKFIPGLILLYAIPIVLKEYIFIIILFQKAIYIYLTILVLLTFNSLLTVVSKMYKTFRATMKIPITALVQGVRIIFGIIAVVIVVAIVLDKSPIIILSGLGALTAVFMFVFKDSLMGFIAGIQLTLNKMVDHGNWIEMPKYGADGTVEDITLTTVKVCNWDKTVTTVPTYALLSESFKNWQGMESSGGRRIKRSIFIDTQTIKFCSTDMLERLSKIQLLSKFLGHKLLEIETDNSNNAVNPSSPVNGRNMTNIGVFRKYIEFYLSSNKNINMDMTFLVRQKQPGVEGLPIEIYVFCKETAWVTYEGIQADIFDHIFAIINEFDLKIFQSPSGDDIKSGITTY